MENNSEQTRKIINEMENDAANFIAPFGFSFVKKWLFNMITLLKIINQRLEQLERRQ